MRRVVAALLLLLAPLALAADVTASFAQIPESARTDGIRIYWSGQDGQWSAQQLGDFLDCRLHSNPQPRVNCFDNTLARPEVRLTVPGQGRLYFSATAYNSAGESARSPSVHKDFERPDITIILRIEP